MTSRALPPSSSAACSRGLRAAGRTLEHARVVIAGAGAAGIGVARLLRMAMRADGLDDAAIRDHIALVDTHGLVHEGRADLDAAKLDLAVPALEAGATGDLGSVVRDRRPNILVGATGVAGTFDEALIRTMHRRTARRRAAHRAAALEPDFGVVRRTRPMSSPGPTGGRWSRPAHRSRRWSTRGRQHQIGQANNVFIFPGLGLGAIVTEARAITDRMFLLAARELAAAVSDDRLAAGALYPPVTDLREVSRRIATVVAEEAVAAGLSAAADRSSEPFDARSAVEAAMWWPDYVPYVRHA